jgi:hypothetical protein
LAIDFVSFNIVLLLVVVVGPRIGARPETGVDEASDEVVKEREKYAFNVLTLFFVSIASVVEKKTTLTFVVEGLA